MAKFWKVATIKKGNKRNFESNVLTEAIAEKQAIADYKKERKQLKRRFKEKLSC